MPEHPGYHLKQISGRSIVSLRVRPDGADAAIEAMELSQQVMHSSGSDPLAHWLGPDKWLLTSDAKPANEMINKVDSMLSGQLFAATDMSSHYACFALAGPAARTVLSMGCGIDMDKDAFTLGQCRQTNFANVLLLIVAVKDDEFDLYVDRSHARYLSDWVVNSGADPMTCFQNDTQ